MTFNSLEFLIFLPIVTLFYYLLPFRFRWMLLLTASCIFYMFFIPQYILILAATIIVDYYAGIRIEKSTGRKKKRYLILSIITTCLILFIFKYYDFFTANLAPIFNYFGINFKTRTNDLILPIGLSFHTFQSLSYVFEVYRGKQKAERHFGMYSLYVMFYPQLVTGPIERPQNLLTQLREHKTFSYQNISKGCRLILYGLFIKMVVADNLAVFVNEIYADPESFHTLSIISGLFFYSIQVYCDFFGYSTIAIGCASLMGYHLVDNFKSPYFTKNLAEFWQKWHISLGTWLRDYVYIPLGGNSGTLKWIRNTLLVFAISGLWHGANWTFILFGLCHGVIYLFEKWLTKTAEKVEIKSVPIQKSISVLKILQNFVLITFSYVIFRSANLEEVGTMFSSIFNNLGTSKILHIDTLSCLILILFIVFEFLLYKKRFDTWCERLYLPFRWGIYSLFVFFIIVFANVDNFPFVYFQF